MFKRSLFTIQWRSVLILDDAPSPLFHNNIKNGKRDRSDVALNEVDDRTASSSPSSVPTHLGTIPPSHAHIPYERHGRRAQVFGKCQASSESYTSWSVSPNLLRCTVADAR